MTGRGRSLIAYPGTPDYHRTVGCLDSRPMIPNCDFPLLGDVENRGYKKWKLVSTIMWKVEIRVYKYVKIKGCKFVEIRGTLLWKVEIWG